MVARDVRVGLDLGGTKLEVSVGVVSAGGVEPLLRRRVPTEQAQGYDAIVERVAALLRDACKECSLPIASVPIGVGMPGGVERRSHLIKNSNTTCLNGRPFRQDLERALGRRLDFENDANCFALSETLLGVAKPFASGWVFGAILGTGVGGGWVLRGELWSGQHGIAGEWGHHGVFAGDPAARACYCQRRGCLEAYASGPAVEAHYHELSGRRARVDEIERLAQQGDGHAREALSQLLDAFGRGVANLIDLCDPSAIVLGGGLSNLACLYDEGRARIARELFNDELTTPILRASLGDSSGVLGAMLIAKPA